MTEDDWSLKGKTIDIPIIECDHTFSTAEQISYSLCKFIMAKHIETLRQKLILDMQKLWLQGEVNRDLAYKGIEYVINKRFGCD